MLKNKVKNYDGKHELITMCEFYLDPNSNYKNKKC